MKKFENGFYSTTNFEERDTEEAFRKKAKYGFNGLTYKKDFKTNIINNFKITESFEKIYNRIRIKYIDAYRIRKV